MRNLPICLPSDEHMSTFRQVHNQVRSTSSGWGTKFGRRQGWPRRSIRLDLLPLERPSRVVRPEVEAAHPSGRIWLLWELQMSGGTSSRGSWLRQAYKVLHDFLTLSARITGSASAPSASATSSSWHSSPLCAATTPRSVSSPPTSLASTAILAQPLTSYPWFWVPVPSTTRLWRLHTPT